MNAILPYEWVSGAIWLLPEGRIIQILGFHDDWIHKNQKLVPGCANVCDVVLKMRWVSVVTYAKKYVELMISSRRDDTAVELVLKYLGLNLEHWESALVMTMDEEGYIKVTAADFNDVAALRSKIGGIQAVQEA